MKVPPTPDEVQRSVAQALRRYTDKVNGYDRELDLIAEEKRPEAIFFWRLSFKEYRDLTIPENVRMISEATARNDHEFFKKLAKALATEPRDAQSHQNKVEELLLTHWFKRDAEPALLSGSLSDFSHVLAVGFCHCNDAVLEGWFQSHVNQSITSKSIRKTWERLGLIKGKIYRRMTRDIRQKISGLCNK